MLMFYAVVTRGRVCTSSIPAGLRLTCVSTTTRVQGSHCQAEEFVGQIQG